MSVIQLTVRYACC